MCGIAGIVKWKGEAPRRALMEQMLAILAHRGPDEFGLYDDGIAALGNARLSIIDLAGGTQPIGNEDGRLWIVFNGEIYNYLDLRRRLIEHGHRFRTRSDTEVFLHLYEELGPQALTHLNGQFAVAIWDRQSRRLFLARDRVGIRPLFYTVIPGGLAFASEMKALLLLPEVRREIDPLALWQTFLFWAPQAPTTAFRDIWELPPATFITIDGERMETGRYWSLDFAPADARPTLTLEEASETLQALLADATRIRLRAADVPVGSYLSGGLDSTYVAALARREIADRLHTYAITFREAAFDERRYQDEAADFLGVEHHRIEVDDAAIAKHFPRVIWHAEAPLLRTAPVPMYALSRLVHERGMKVVLTGEGADEFFAGYNIFKEMQLRRFWARDPDSALRPCLLPRLYPYVAALREGGAFTQAFFSRGMQALDQPAYSHLLRWHNGLRLVRFLARPLRESADGDRFIRERIACLQINRRWPPLSQAQYLEVRTFMSPYLLSSQGDRMMAANSVEGRFPFLDHRVIAFAAALPPTYKLIGLQEKRILKRSARGLLPPSVLRRRKQPYRAPIAQVFLGPHAPAYVDEMLSPAALRESGYFDPQAVGFLLRKGRARGNLSETEAMALVAVLSTQWLHHHFVRNFPPALPPLRAPIKRVIIRLP